MTNTPKTHGKIEEAPRASEVPSRRRAWHHPAFFLLIFVVPTALLFGVVRVWTPWPEILEPVAFTLLGVGVVLSSIAIARSMKLAPTSLENDSYSEKDVVTFVKRALTSDDVLSVFRTSLPTGKDDRLHGFDYIPWMLDACNQRREKCLRAASRFLILTLLLGVTFSGVLVFFGYLLVNEEAAGFPRTVTELGRNSASLESSVHWLLPATTTDAAVRSFKDTVVAPAVGSLYHDFLDESSELDRADRELTTTGDFGKFKATLDAIQARIEASGSPDSITAVAEIKGVRAKLAEFETTQAAKTLQLFDVAKQQSALIGDIRKRYDDGGGHVAEILKRLGIGFVLASFFIALLRYVAGLYKENYQQSLLAEQDELAIRRFYVAYRCSSGDGIELKKAVFDMFMQGTPRSPAESKTGSDTATYDTHELLKELLSTLAKKV